MREKGPGVGGAIALLLYPLTNLLFQSLLTRHGLKGGALLTARKVRRTSQRERGNLPLREGRPPPEGPRDTERVSPVRPTTPPRGAPELRSRADAASADTPPPLDSQEDWDDSHYYSGWGDYQHYSDYWNWPYYCQSDYPPQYPGGYPGHKGKGSFQWIPKGKGKGTPAGGPYKKKKNNKGVNRPLWWSQHKGKAKGSNKGSGSGKGKRSGAPEGGAAESPPPADPSVPDPATAPAVASEGTPAATPPSQTPSGGEVGSAEAALEARSRSWADASEDAS